MKYKIIHKTTYQYSKDVSHCYNIAHLKPRDFERQHCTSHNLAIEPMPANIRHNIDIYGNQRSYFNVQNPHRALIVTATSEVEVHPPVKFDQALDSPSWEKVIEMLKHSQDPADLDAMQYLVESPYIVFDSQMVIYASSSFKQGRPLLAAVNDLMSRIFHDFDYDPNFTTIATPLTEVMKHRRGVCQDFAHLAISCLLAMGIPARYVSGYLETRPPPGKKKLQGADASHAWFSVYVPESGWVDFDPTNNRIPMNEHIVTAWGRDYGDVTPLKGIIFGGGDKHLLDVEVDVIPLDIA